ncbi:MAG: tRNA pseudouridine(55) synthase TruB [Candidatus Kapabacteria bacterium]|nr:tRNA pseudouridine(55) synthase TruB [Candidatus Kapabacteria bacterium]
MSSFGILDKFSINNLDSWLQTSLANGGIALIDKEKSWTSFDACAKLKGITRIPKVGHAGTLDPLATGLLIICFGKATKSISIFQDYKKSYFARIKLGATTRTLDAELEEENICDISNLKEEEIYQFEKKYRGEMSQMPPIFSSKKINGKRLYKYARNNEEVQPKPSIINIYDLSIKKIELPFVDVEIECSKGTYVRSIARDIGIDLGVGAYLADLRRTAIGEYKADNAIKISEIQEQIKNPNI